MNGTTEQMRNKIERVSELGSVVRTMKALAASNIGQFEESVRSLESYFQTLQMGLYICLYKQKKTVFLSPPSKSTDLIIFGTDQGLVGQFNESLSQYFVSTFETLKGKKRVRVVGEKMNMTLQEAGIQSDIVYPEPHAVYSITQFTGKLLMDTSFEDLIIFHNRPVTGARYESVSTRLLPLDEKWFLKLIDQNWPSNRLPETIGRPDVIFSYLLSEYLFVSLFKACTESIAAEHASRLAAMQRAEKNIGELLGELQQTYHRVRQNSIDEELFDIISGFQTTGSN